MITKEDQQVIDFLTKFKVATTSQLVTFYTSKRYGQYRLTKLAEEYKAIKRQRENVIKEYIYSMKKINNRTILHDLGLTNFYIEVGKVVKIEKCLIQPKIDKMIPDMIIGYTRRGKDYICFVEYQRSTNPFNLDKYLKFYYSDRWKQYFDVFPRLIVISNQHIQKITDFEVIQIREDLSDIENIKAR